MTQIQIETQLGAELGCIEMRPPLDTQSLDIVHDLGLVGIKHISECEDKNGESMIFGFNRTECGKLDRDARTIADALHKAGSEVSLNEIRNAEETKQEPEPPHYRRLGSLIFGRSKNIKPALVFEH